MPQLQSRNHLVQDHNVVSDVDMMMHSWDQIFNPEAAKSMFTKLFHLMDQQNGTIEKLEAKVHRVESYLPTQLEHKDREIQKLTQQLKATQSQLAQVQNQNHQHAQQLRKLEKIGADHDIQLSNCHNQLELVHDQSRSVMKTLHQDTIRMEHYDTLQEGLEQLVQAQEALGKVLECKMNKLEGHQVESMCAKMKNYLQSFDRLTSQLEAAQQDLSQVQSTLTRESSLARDTASKVQTLSGQIHDCVLPELKYIQETALVSIERTCDQHQEQLEVLELCTRDNRRSIDELERHVKHSQVKLTKTFVTLKGKINQAVRRSGVTWLGLIYRDKPLLGV